MNQSGPIKIQWSSLVVEEVAILFSVVQPFTTKAGGGMRAKPTAWCSKNLRQNFCNCGYVVPNHESFISTKILRFFKHLMSSVNKYTEYVYWQNESEATWCCKTWDRTYVTAVSGFPNNRDLSRDDGIKEFIKRK